MYAGARHNPIWDYACDWVREGDNVSVLPQLGEYDILVMDMLEHMGCDEGLHLLADCLDHGESVIVSAPAESGSVGTAHGDRREQPLSFRTRGESASQLPVAQVLLGAFALPVQQARYPAWSSLAARWRGLRAIRGCTTGAPLARGTKSASRLRRAEDRI